MSDEIQTVLVPRKTERHEYTLAEARALILKMGYKTTFYGKGVDTKKNFYRFRQNAPRGPYRTATLPNGVLIVYQPKKLRRDKSTKVNAK